MRISKYTHTAPQCTRLLAPLNWFSDSFVYSGNHGSRAIHNVLRTDISLASCCTDTYEFNADRCWQQNHLEMLHFFHPHTNRRCFGKELLQVINGRQPVQFFLVHSFRYQPGRQQRMVLNYTEAVGHVRRSAAHLRKSPSQALALSTVSRTRSSSGIFALTLS